MANHLMVVGAHISDAENMAGAVMLKHKRAGWDLSIVHYYEALGTTRGALGHFTKAVTLMRPPSIYSHDSVAGLLVE